jgi:formamidopyrimidine-DNA glycosylase
VTGAAAADQPLKGTVPTVVRSATADLTGQRIVGWVSRGKHLLSRTDAAITVHSHLRMSGRWTGLGMGQAAAAVLITLELVARGRIRRTEPSPAARQRRERWLRSIRRRRVSAG